MSGFSETQMLCGHNELYDLQVIFIYLFFCNLVFLFILKKSTIFCTIRKKTYTMSFTSLQVL